MRETVKEVTATTGMTDTTIDMTGVASEVLLAVLVIAPAVGPHVFMMSTREQRVTTRKALS